MESKGGERDNFELKERDFNLKKNMKKLSCIGLDTLISSYTALLVHHCTGGHFNDIDII